MSAELRQREQDMEAEALRVNAGRKPKFGDLMRNPWAGESNPERDGYFVRSRRVTGRMNPGLWYEFTDRNGKFWETGGKFAMFLASPATPPAPTPAAAEGQAEARLKYNLRELLSSLPIRRDWLNPDVERELRAIESGIAPSAAPLPRQAAVRDGTKQERMAFNATIDAIFGAPQSVPATTEKEAP